MIISLNEIKQLVDIKLPDNELLDLIGSRLVEIESISDWSKRYKKVYIVKVLTAEPISGTHLSLCQIDAGAELNASVDPEHADSIQVVCGAPNVKAGMFAVWIAPGAFVPATVETAEPFEISARKLRGFTSFGMLAGADELGLGDDHSGIVELDPNVAQPGASFAEVFGLNDLIIEVENKSLTHRPDCFGLIGFAREVAGVLGQPFSEPIALKDYDLAQVCRRLQAQITGPGEPLTLAPLDPSCPAYCAQIFTFKKLPVRSPYLTLDDIFLYKAGMRPLSPIVDLTNLIMLKTGQPLHAFDYDKFVAVGAAASKVAATAPVLGVRLAREHEQLELLDGHKLELNSSDIVITSADAPVALAGAMGGQSTAIDETTRKVLLEAATFPLANLRKTQMAHGIFSEAVTRFTKGRPASDLAPAVQLAHAAFRALQATPTTILTATCPETVAQSGPNPAGINVSVAEINSLLGASYSKELIVRTLENVSFQVAELKSNPSSDANSTAALDSPLLHFVAPAWRNDIKIKEDIIEEVGRLLGYDNLPLTFPTRPFVCATVDPLLTLKTKLRTILSDRLGANEVLTYSFVSDQLLAQTGFELDDAYKIVNSISPALERFRPSLIPSLLSKLPENLKAGYKDFSLYELNQVSAKSLGLNSEQVPVMANQLAQTVFGDFYALKFILNTVAATLGYQFAYLPLASSTLFEPKHSAELYLQNPDASLGAKIGLIGEIKASVLQKFKLSTPVAAYELSLDALIESAGSSSALSGAKSPLATKLENSVFNSKFPAVSRDLTLKLQPNLTYAEVEQAILKTLATYSQIRCQLEPLSIYAPDPATKHLSFRLVLTNLEKTFASEEVSAIMEKITDQLSTLGAEVV